MGWVQKKWKKIIEGVWGGVKGWKKKSCRGVIFTWKSLRGYPPIWFLKVVKGGPFHVAVSQYCDLFRVKCSFCQYKHAGYIFSRTSCCFRIIFPPIRSRQYYSNHHFRPICPPFCLMYWQYWQLNSSITTLSSQDSRYKYHGLINHNFSHALIYSKALN